MGRFRKFELGDTAYDKNKRRYAAVVAYRIGNTIREYRVVPLDFKMRRAGRAYWQRPHHLRTTGLKSKGSAKTYIVNEKLEERYCDCQCCVHEAIDLGDFNRWGDWDPVP